MANFTPVPRTSAIARKAGVVSGDIAVGITRALELANKAKGQSAVNALGARVSELKIERLHAKAKARPSQRLLLRIEEEQKKRDEHLKRWSELHESALELEAIADRLISIARRSAVTKTVYRCQRMPARRRTHRSHRVRAAGAARSTADPDGEPPRAHVRSSIGGAP